jgi:hypothetical protein
MRSKIEDDGQPIRYLVQQEMSPAALLVFSRAETTAELATVAVQVRRVEIRRGHSSPYLRQIARGEAD